MSTDKQGHWPKISCRKYERASKHYRADRDEHGRGWTDNSWLIQMKANCGRFVIVITKYETEEEEYFIVKITFISAVFYVVLVTFIIIQLNFTLWSDL